MTEQHSIPPEYIGYKDIAREYLPGVSIGTLRAWCSQGILPRDSIKIGRRRLWRRSVIEAFIRERENDSAA